MFEFNANRETEIAGQVYRIDQLDTFKQLHIYRRIAPLLTGFINSAIVRKDSVITQMVKKSADDVELADVLIKDIDDKQALLVGLIEMVNAISRMSNDDFEYVVKSALSAAKRKDGEQYAPLLTPAGHFAYQDISSGATLYLTAAVIMGQNGMAEFLKKFLAAGGPEAPGTAPSM